MLPIVINPDMLRVLVIGDGPATDRRVQMLVDAKVEHVHMTTAEIPDDEFGIVFIADFDEETSEELYRQAKEMGAFVNAEDILHLCDFHVPAIVRRGDLLMTVSTGGSSPRLARRIRMALEQLFPENWSQKIAEVKTKRQQWKAEGAGFEEVAQKTDALLEEQGCMKVECECLKRAA